MLNPQCRDAKSSRSNSTFLGPKLSGRAVDTTWIPKRYPIVATSTGPQLSGRAIRDPKLANNQTRRVGHRITFTGPQLSGRAIRDAKSGYSVHQERVHSSVVEQLGTRNLAAQIQHSWVQSSVVEQWIPHGYLKGIQQWQLVRVHILQAFWSKSSFSNTVSDTMQQSIQQHQRCVTYMICTFSNSILYILRK